MARKNPDTNSFRKMALATRSSFMEYPRNPSFRHHAGDLQHGGDDGHHGERERKENLPAEPHQLIVAIARHDRLGDAEQEEEEQRLEQEPHDPRYPRERRQRKRRQPAPPEQDR